MEFATYLRKLSFAGVSTSTVPPSFDKKRKEGLIEGASVENFAPPPVGSANIPLLVAFALNGSDRAFPTDCLFPFLNDSSVLRAVDRVARVAVPPVLFELAGVVAPTSRCSTQCLRHSTYLARSGGIMASAHVWDRGSEVCFQGLLKIVSGRSPASDCRVSVRFAFVPDSELVSPDSNK